MVVSNEATNNNGRASNLVCPLLNSQCVGAKCAFTVGYLNEDTDGNIRGCGYYCAITQIATLMDSDTTIIDKPVDYVSMEDK